MTTLTDSYLSPNYVDGEGIYLEDIQQGERGALARMLDQLFERAVPGIVGSALADGPDVDYPSTQNGLNTPTGTMAIALTVSGGMPIQGSANNKVKVAAGTLLQKISAATGTDMTIVPFTFDGTQEQTITNGDPSQPRIDLLQMKLALVASDSASRDVEDATTDAPSSQAVNTSWRVQCTLNIKAGVAGATPAWPAPDAGFVAIAAIYVGTNYTGANPLNFDDTTGANATVWDLRMPINVQSYRVDVNAMSYDTTKWTLDGTRRKLTAGAAATDLIIPCPVTKGRIVGVAITTKGANTCQGILGLDFADQFGVLQMAVMRGILNTTATILEQQNSFRYWDNPSGLGGIAIGNNYGPLNIPVWANGRRAARETFNVGTGDGLNGDTGAGGGGAPGTYAALRIASAPNAMVVYEAKFFVAVGL